MKNLPLSLIAMPTREIFKRHRPKSGSVYLAKITQELKARETHHKEVYNTAAWRKLRQVIFTGQPVCISKGCTQAANTLDHIKPMTEGGASWDRKNLQGLCKACHDVKSRKETARRMRLKAIIDKHGTGT